MNHKKTIGSAEAYHAAGVITEEERVNVMQFYTQDENKNWIIRKLSADA